MLFNYKDMMTDANNLYKSYKKSKSCCNWKQYVHFYEHNWLLYITRLQESLINEDYKCEKCTYFTLKERGKTRYITARGMNDKIVRHSLNDLIIMPAMDKYLIYDNGASRKNLGINHTRKRFEQHLHNYYRRHKSNKGYILLLDFSKYYDNIIHSVAKQQILDKLDKTKNIEYISWLLDIILDEFKVDVSYLSDDEYENCIHQKFDSLQYKELNPPKLGKKYLYKSIDIGDQTSQSIGILYLHRLDNYIKIVLGIKEYGRYMDDLYIISETIDELKTILNNIKPICYELGLFINYRKTKIYKLSDTYTFLQNKYSLTCSGKIIKRTCSGKIVDMRRKLNKLCNKIITYKTIDTDRFYLYFNGFIFLYKSWSCNYFKVMTNLQRHHMIHLYEVLFKSIVIGG